MAQRVSGRVILKQEDAPALAPEFHAVTQDDLALFRARLAGKGVMEGFVKRNRGHALVVLEKLVNGDTPEQKSTAAQALAEPNVVFWLCADLNTPGASQRVAGLISKFSQPEQERILKADKAAYALCHFGAEAECVALQTGIARSKADAPSNVVALPSVTLPSSQPGSQAMPQLSFPLSRLPTHLREKLIL